MFTLLIMKRYSFRGYSKANGSDGLCGAGFGVRWRWPDEFGWTKEVTRRKQCKFYHCIKLLLPYIFNCKLFWEFGEFKALCCNSNVNPDKFKSKNIFTGKLSLKRIGINRQNVGLYVIISPSYIDILIYWYIYWSAIKTNFIC